MNLIANIQYPATELDDVSVLGFVLGFFTLVYLLYRREIKSKLPLSAILYAGLSVYGFSAGVWPLGFVLLGLTASELHSWWQPRPATPRFMPAPRRLVEIENAARLTRMFGP